MMSRITLNLKRMAITDPVSERDTYLHPRTIESRHVVNFDERPGTIRKSRGVGKTTSQASSSWQVADVSFDDTTTRDDAEWQTVSEPSHVTCGAESSVPESVEAGALAYSPGPYAVLSERDAYELRALRASAVQHA